MNVATLTRTEWWSKSLASREVLETSCRRASPSFGLWATVLGGLKVRIDPRDESVCPHLLRDGFWESWLSLAMARAIRQGWRCVDVGAHVGYFTALMADRVGITGSVVSIEPQPWYCDLLQQTSRNLPASVHVYCSAIGSRIDDRDLLLYGGLTGSASFWPAQGWDVTGRIPVPVRTLDALLGGHHCDFVKVDVEGAEVEVWDGATQFRRVNPDAIWAVEVASNRHYDLPSFLGRVQFEGYPLRLVAGDGSIQDASIESIVERGEELPVLWLQRP